MPRSILLFLFLTLNVFLFAGWSTLHKSYKISTYGWSEVFKKFIYERLLKCLSSTSSQWANVNTTSRMSNRISLNHRFVLFLIFSSKELLMMEAVKTLLSVYSTGEGVTTFQCFANLDWRMQNTRNTRIQDLKFFLMLFCYLWIVFLPCGCLLLTTFVACIFYANVSFWKILTL